MQSQYTNSRFTTEHLNGAVRTTQGASAGTTYADIVYGAAFAKVLNTVIKALEGDDLLSSHQFPKGKFTFLPVAFLDDVVFPSKADSAQDVVPRSVAIVRSATFVFKMYNLEINLKRGKTVVVPVFVGKGKSVAEKKLQENDFQHEFDIFHRSMSLFFDSTYKHMGTQFHINTEFVRRWLRDVVS